MSIVISGEKLQNIADVYFGLSHDFSYNPYINNHRHKHTNLLNINTFYNNPKIIFCYTHRINILSDKIKYFMNNFILITHNSDENIAYDTPAQKLIIEKICACDKLIKWFSQNLCIEHNKINFLPIGIANQQWEHGAHFTHFYNNINKSFHKNKSIYFFFEILTNKNKRQMCYDTLIHKLPFLNKIQPIHNFQRLSEYEFCICPEGNGIDTHRFWEALYLKCVPIVIKNPLTEIIHKNTTLPMVILSTWDEFDINNLPPYRTFDFESSSKFLDLNFYINIIKTA